MKQIFIFILTILSFKANAQSKKLLFYMEDGKFGYKDTTGKVIIAPSFTFAFDFSEGLAVAGKGENKLSSKYGFINTKGEWVIPPSYNAADEFSEGLARVQINGKWGYIDKTGKIIITPQFQLCYEFKNGYAMAQIKNKFGLIDKTGKFIITPEYYNLTNFSGEALGLQKTMFDPWFLADISGNQLNEKTFSRMSNFSNGLAPARNNDDLWGFINEKGAWVVMPKYTGAHIFSEGFAFVETDYANWTFIDTKGNEIVSPQYDRFAIFKNGYARVEKGQDILYINTAGKVIFSFKR